MKKIIFTEDGKLVVRSFTGSLESAIENMKDSPDHEVIDSSELPADKSYRAAWCHDKTNSPQKISVNVALARDIGLGRVRANVAGLMKTEVDDIRDEALRENVSQIDANALVDARRTELKGATDKLKALDVNKRGIISVEAAAELLLPLEL